MLQKIWKIVIFHLSLYNKTWDSPTLINLTNLTREARRREASDLFFCARRTKTVVWAHTSALTGQHPALPPGRPASPPPERGVARSGLRRNHRTIAVARNAAAAIFPTGAGPGATEAHIRHRNREYPGAQEAGKEPAAGSDNAQHICPRRSPQRAYSDPGTRFGAADKIKFSTDTPVIPQTINGGILKNVNYFSYFCINWKIMNLNAEVL